MNDAFIVMNNAFDRAWIHEQSFTKDKERIHKIEKAEDSRYISQNKLYKNCFQIDMDYGDIKD